MRIVDEIKRICAGIDGVKSVMYENAAVANVRLDRAQFPAAVLYCITDWSIDGSKGFASETAQVNVFFLERMNSLDYSGDNAQAIVDRTASMAMDFYAGLLASKVVAVDGTKLEIRSVYDADDACVCGVSVQFTARELGGVCIGNHE